MRFQAHEGQTIIEMVVALGALTVGFLGIIILLNSSLGFNEVVSNNYRGTYLAAEGIELVKNIVDTNDDKCDNWRVGLPAGNYQLDYHLSVPETWPCDNLPEYSGLYPIDGKPLYYHSDTGFYDHNEVNAKPTIFYRTVLISYLGTPEGMADDQMVVQSLVRWKDKTGDNEVNLIDYFFNPSSTIP
ncbi:MAG: hypothetical protein AAB691_00155 [Patescibacteria group bacterium]